MSRSAPRRSRRVQRAVSAVVVLGSVFVTAVAVIVAVTMASSGFRAGGSTTTGDNYLSAHGAGVYVNDAPWPVELVELEPTNGAPGAVVGVLSEGAAPLGVELGWPQSLPRDTLGLPRTLAPGESAALVVVLPAPTGDSVFATGVSAVVRGPFGLSMRTWTDSVQAYSEPVPDAVLASDPAEDLTSLHLYLRQLAGEFDDPVALATLLGGDRDEWDARVFIAEHEAGAARVADFETRAIRDDPTRQRVAFIPVGAEEGDEFPSFRVEWIDGAWTVTRFSTGDLAI